MLQLKDNGKTYRFFDKYLMMLERDSTNGNNIGDAMWRTSLALIAYGDNLANAIAKNIQVDDYKKRSAKFYRHPDLDYSDTSRDQVIMADCAGRLRSPAIHQKIQMYSNYRISNKFTWQENWFWLQEKYFWWRLLGFYNLIFLWFQPSYSIHIRCWMMYCSGQKMPLYRWVLRKIVPKSNYLLRLLIGEKIPLDYEVIPCKDFQWQREEGWINEDRILTGEELEYNALDVDIIKAVLELNYERLNKN